MPPENEHAKEHAKQCEVAGYAIQMHHAVHKILELYKDFDPRSSEEIQLSVHAASHVIQKQIETSAEFGIKFVALFSILGAMALEFQAKSDMIQESYELTKRISQHENN